MKKQLSSEELQMRDNILELALSGEKYNEELAYQLLLSVNLNVEDLFDNNDTLCEFANKYLKSYHSDIWVPKFYIDKNTGYRTLDYSYSDLTPKNEYPFIRPLVQQLMTHLYGTYAQEQPAIVYECPHLKSLHIDVDEFVFEEFPYEILDIQQLENLYLKFYTVANVPAQISKLKNLKSLGVVTSYIFNIPPSIRELSQLEHITIQTSRSRPKDTEIERYRQNFYTSLCNLMLCPKLKSLELTIADGINNINCIGNIEKLEKLSLNISVNLIETLPDILIKLKRLEDVEIKLFNKSMPVNVQAFEKAINILKRQYNFSCI